MRRARSNKRHDTLRPHGAMLSSEGRDEGATTEGTSTTRALLPVLGILRPVVDATRRVVQLKAEDGGRPIAAVFGLYLRTRTALRGRLTNADETSPPSRVSWYRPEVRKFGIIPGGALPAKVDLGRVVG